MKIPIGHKGKSWFCKTQNGPILKSSDVNADNDNALSLCCSSLLEQSSQRFATEDDVM